MAKKKDVDKSVQGSESNKTTKTETNEDEEPNFSDPEDFVHHVSDEGKY